MIPDATTGKDVTVRMNAIKFMFLLAAIVVLALTGLSFALPVDTHAHPAYGFTPPAPPPPPGGGNGSGGGNSGNDDDSGRDNRPANTVTVQLGQCDLVCSASQASGNNQTLAVSTDSGNRPASAEVQVRAKLVHRGSGFIVETTLSDAKSTRVAVPYPGQWELFMVGAPEFVTGQTMNVTGLNLAQLQADVANTPVLLGVVEANTANTQWVKCPLECVVQTVEQPLLLPETGAGPQTGLTVLLAAGVFLVAGGFLMTRSQK